MSIHILNNIYIYIYKSTPEGVCYSKCDVLNKIASSRARGANVALKRVLRGERGRERERVGTLTRRGRGGRRRFDHLGSCEGHHCVMHMRTYIHTCT